MTDTKHPEESRRKLRELHAAASGEEKAHRAELWRRAETSVRAARELDRRIRQDIEGQELIRSHLSGLADGGEARRAVDEDRAEAEKQVARLSTLTRHRRPVRRASAPSPLQWLAFGVMVAAGIVAYILAFVALARALHLEDQAAFSISGGGLFALIGLLGLSPLLNDAWVPNPIAIYVLAAGLVLVGFGIWRETLIVRGRIECTQALASESDVHRRLRLLDSLGAKGIPNLDEGAFTNLSCRELLR
jgi:hypothetical protein